MTIPVRIRGAAGKRHAPRLPDHLFSSDPCFRVPPTGIPKPDPDEVPPALQWRGRLAGMACAMLLVFGSGGMASASSSGGLNWQFGGLPGSVTIARAATADWRIWCRRHRSRRRRPPAPGTRKPGITAAEDG